MKQLYEGELQDQQIENIIHLLDKVGNISIAIPDWLKKDNRFLRFISAEDQVEAIWETFKRGDSSIWPLLSLDAQSLCIYRAVKERQSTSFLLLSNNHPFINFMLSMCKIRECPDKNDVIFDEANNLLESYIVQEAYRSTEKFHMGLLLPPCDVTHSNVRFCEGRHWFDKGGRDKVDDYTGDMVAWCPRMGAGCDIVNHARIYSNKGRSWQHWSLHELLEACDVTPTCDELDRKDPRVSRRLKYVLSLSGYINRLSEIRSRLNCSECQQLLLPNKAYARLLARSQTTIFECPDKHESVYINYCWRCNTKNLDSIIDSRQNTIIVENFRLCLKCGSGPLSQSTNFQAGNQCPKCGLKSMQCINDNPKKKEYLCRSQKCNHKIIVPVDTYITRA